MSAADDYRAALAHFNTSAVILHMAAQHEDLPDSIEQARQNHRLSLRRLDDAVRALIAEAWKCGQLAPQILAEVDQRKLTFAAGLLPKEGS